MRRDTIRDVEIVEPPIQELSKKRGSFAKSCLTGCGGLLLFIALVIVGAKLYIGPGPKELRAVPESFPSDVDIYDGYNVDKVILISGRYKSRGLKIASFFPKIILSPLLVSMTNNETAGQQTASGTAKLGAREILRILSMPVGDERDTVQIEWRDIPVEPIFMTAYYQSKLAEKKFQIDSQSEGDDYEQFTFSRSDGIDGTVYAKRGADKKSISYAFLLVNYPSANSTKK